MNTLIRKIEDDFEQVVNVIRDSFITVAKDFNLTKEKVPSNGAFIEHESILKMHEKGTEMFGIFEENKCVGFVAIENPHEEVYWLEKLAVLPECRHKGYGKDLIDFVINRVSTLGGKTVSISIINEIIYLNNGT